MTKDAWLTGDSNATSLYDAEADIDIVTGDAVLLDFRPCSVVSRCGALILDAIVYVTCYVAMIIGVLMWAAVDYQVAGALVTLITPVVFVIVPTIIETATGGQSLGKKALGIRVVRDDAGPIRWQQSFIRALVGVIEVWAMSGAIAFFVSVANSQGKRMGDMLAGTMVIASRGQRIEDWTPPDHPVLAGWAARADVDQVPALLEYKARSAVMRRAEVTPQVYQQLLTNVVHDLAQYVYPGPPQGSSAEDIVVAVLAQRYRQSVDRLQARSEDTWSVLARARNQ